MGKNVTLQNVKNVTAGTNCCRFQVKWALVAWKCYNSHDNTNKIRVKDYQLITTLIAKVWILAWKITFKSKIMMRIRVRTKYIHIQTLFRLSVFIGENQNHFQRHTVDISSGHCSDFYMQLFQVYNNICVVTFFSWDLVENEKKEQPKMVVLLIRRQEQMP